MVSSSSTENPNDLYDLAVQFSSILDDLDIGHVYVSGYVVILTGRSRATEDIDVLLEYIDPDTIGRLVDRHEEHGMGPSDAARFDGRNARRQYLGCPNRRNGPPTSKPSPSTTSTTGLSRKQHHRPNHQRRFRTSDRSARTASRVQTLPRTPATRRASRSRPLAVTVYPLRRHLPLPPLDRTPGRSPLRRRRLVGIARTPLRTDRNDAYPFFVGSESERYESHAHGRPRAHGARALRVRPRRRRTVSGSVDHRDGRHGGYRARGDVRSASVVVPNAGAESRSETVRRRRIDRRARRTRVALDVRRGRREGGNGR